MIGADEDASGHHQPPRESGDYGRRRLVGARRALFNRRALGRTVMVAAVVAAISCVVGIVVAWRLVGDLRQNTNSSLLIARDTLMTVDDTLDVADSIVESVDGGLDTVRTSLGTVSTSVEDGAAALDVVADLAESLPPNLEGIDTALGGLQSAAEVVDDVLREVSNVPFGPDYDPEQDLGSAVDAVRSDLEPISTSLMESSDSLRDLSGSSDELLQRLDELAGDLDEIDQSLADSQELIDRYRTSTNEALVLASTLQEDLDRDVRWSRALIVTLGLAIAVGQIAPFRVGRELARR